jgi:hypothetical protein
MKPCDDNIICQCLIAVGGIRLAEEVPLPSSCERGNEPRGSIRGGEFLNQLRAYQLHNDTRPNLFFKTSRVKPPSCRYRKGNV